MKKLLCALLALCLVLSAFAGCQSKKGGPVPTSAGPNQQNPESPYNKHLVYTMTDADVEKFSADLLALEQLYLQGASIEEIDMAEDALEDLTEFIWLRLPLQKDAQNVFPEMRQSLQAAPRKYR